MVPLDSPDRGVVFVWTSCVGGEGGKGRRRQPLPKTMLLALLHDANPYACNSQLTRRCKRSTFT